MPIYEFECAACARVSEHIMKVSDKNPEVCPHCGESKSLSKLMSRTSFVLKGQGWYETDFKKSPKSSSSSSSSSSTSATKPTDSTGSSSSLAKKKP